MEFDLNEMSGITGMYLMGASFPTNLCFMIFSLTEDPLATLLFSIFGGISLIGGVILMFLNSRGAGTGKASENSDTIRLIFLGTMFADFLFMIIGTIAMV